MMGNDAISLDSISLPLERWEQIDSGDHNYRYTFKDSKDLLSIWFFEGKPDVPSVSSKEKLLTHYRKEIKDHFGGIIEVETLSIKGIPSVKSILKFPGDSGEGPIYLGSITIPFEEFGFVIKLQSFSNEDWKLRESFVLGLVKNDYPKEEKQEILENWAKDPYGNTKVKGELHNFAERLEFDEQFPDHALSRLRNQLKWIQNNVRLNSAVMEAKRYREGNNKKKFLGLF
jgi:hypothetical protein